MLRDLDDILVAPPREVDYQDPVTVKFIRRAEGKGDGVGRLECRDDALRAGEAAEGLERFGIGGHLIPDPAGILQHGVFRADGRMVEPGGDAHPDDDEFVQVELVPLSRIPRMIKSGEIQDVKTLAALLHLAWTRGLAQSD